MESGKEFDGKGNDDPLSKNKNDFMALSKELININIKRNIITPSMGAAYIKAFFVILVLSFAFLLINLLNNPFNLNLLLHETIDNLRLLPFAVILNHLFTFVMIYLHELSHILFARKYGIYMKNIKLRLYMAVNFFISVQLPGLYTLKPSERGMIALAGPLTNLLIANFSLGYFLLLNPSQLFKKFLILSSLYNYKQVVNNLNPFIPTDGYHFFSTYFFDEPDIKSSLLFELKKGKIRNLSIKHKMYLLLYATSILFLLITANKVLSVGIAFIVNKFEFSRTIEIITAIVGRVYCLLLILSNLFRFLRPVDDKKKGKEVL